MTLLRDAEGMAFPDDFTGFPQSEGLERLLMDSLSKGEWVPEEDEVLRRSADMDAVRLSEGEWTGFDAHLSEVLIDGEPAAL